MIVGYSADALMKYLKDNTVRQRILNECYEEIGITKNTPWTPEIRKQIADKTASKLMEMAREAQRNEAK